MASLIVPDEQTYATFTVVSSTSSFPFTFAIFEKADLTVLVDGVALALSDFTLSGTLLDSGGYQGGTVVLNTAVAGVTLRIERNIAPARASNYAPSASVPVRSVDQALNRQMAVSQDHARRITDVEAVVESAVGEVSDAAIALVNDAADLKLTAIAAAGDDELAQIGTAGDAELVDIGAAGTTQTGLVNAAGVTQVGLVEAAGIAAIGDVEDAAVALFYADTAAGIAATSDGEFFNTETDGRVTTYQNVSGVATFVVDRASGVEVAAAQDKIEEQRRDVALRVTGAVDDVDGKLAFGVDIFSGEMVGGGVDLLLGRVRDGVAFQTPGEDAHPVAALNGVIGMGQSLMNGNNSRPILSVEQPYLNRMFVGGVLRPTGSGLASFSPLVSADNGLHGETILPALANEVARRSGGQYPSLGVSWAVDGTGIANLQKGSPGFTGMIAAVTAAQGLCAAAYEGFAVQAFTFIQGEQDENAGTARATYAASLATLISDAVTDTKAITGQTHDPKFLFDQVSSWTIYSKTTPTIALAQLDAYEADPVNRILIGPKYFLTYATDGIHLSAHAERWLGLLYAKVYWKVVVLGESWGPLRPLAVEQETARSVIATFHVPSGPLVLDDVLVTDPGDYGFQVFDSGGEKTISSVTLLGQDKVRIVVTTDIGSSPELHYACESTALAAAGPITGPRGCLRDSDPFRADILDADGRPYPLYNWCVHFKEAVV